MTGYQRRECLVIYNKLFDKLSSRLTTGTGKVFWFSTDFPKPHQWWMWMWFPWRIDFVCRTPSESEWVSEFGYRMRSSRSSRTAPTCSWNYTTFPGLRSQIPKTRGSKWLHFRRPLIGWNPLRQSDTLVHFNSKSRTLQGRVREKHSILDSN